jgi:hypothetical protein
MGNRNLVQRKARAKRPIASKSRPGTSASLTTYYQGTPPYDPLGKLSTPKKSLSSVGMQKDRTNTPIQPDKKNPNKRIGGLSDLAISVSQQIQPKPSSF